jgi:hypothetical protein
LGGNTGVSAGVAAQGGKKCCRDLFACRLRRHTGRDAGATEGTTNMVSTPKSALLAKSVPFE